ncbi:MAG: DUF2283 domain-containing protein [Nitrospirae bacterium]|nr:DUF2283 domain-containing protein [Nitrospirota bacterium]
MKIIYDPENDIIDLILGAGEVAESDEIREGVIVDYDSDGKVVSIEILDASEKVSDPMGIQYEVKARSAA